MKHLKNRKARVAVVRIENDINKALRELLTLLSGLKSFIAPLQTVFIKPNWVCNKPYTTGTITNPYLIRACIEEVKKCGAKKIYIGDSSMIGEDTSAVIRENKFEEQSTSRVSFIDLKKEEYIPVGISNASKYRRLSFHKKFLESDFVINIPVLKTHDYLPASLGLKNMKGLLKDSDKRKFHLYGLEEGIIDTNRIALPNLTIIDGSVGMEGNGPINGSPVNLNVLIGSEDPLAAETIALEMMGIDSTQVQYLNLACAAGLGEIRLSEIEVLGDDIESLKHNFTLSTAWTRKKEGKIKLSCTKACTSCKYIIDSLLSPKFESFIKTNIEIFAGGSTPETASSNFTIGIGNCCKLKAETYDVFVEGCPPALEYASHKILDRLIAKQEN